MKILNYVDSIPNFVYVSLSGQFSQCYNNCSNIILLSQICLEKKTSYKFEKFRYFSVSILYICLVHSRVV